MGVLDFFRSDITPDRFVAIVLRRMSKIKEFQELTYDKDLFCVKFKHVKNQSNTFNLHNVYQDYKKVEPKKRAEVLDKYILAFASPSDLSDRDSALKNLMPVIRDKATYEIALLMARLSGVVKASNVTPTRPFLGHLGIALVVDSEHSTTTVTQGKLDEWGLDFDAAFKIAMDNLRDKTEAKFRTNGKGVFISAWSDVYDASRLLLTDMLYRLSIKGEPVVAIPSRNHLLVTGSRDEQGINEIVDLAAEILANDTRPLAAQLFHFHDGEWVLFHGASSAKEKLSKAEYQLIMGVYEDQKKLLTQIYEKENVDVFVASYRVYNNSQLGGLIGTTQWTRGVVTLLPRSDHLWFFCNLKREIISAPWEAAAAIVGLVAEPSVYPERYLVKEFPSDEQLTKLRECAVSVWNVPDNGPTQAAS